MIKNLKHSTEWWLISLVCSVFAVGAVNAAEELDNGDNVIKSSLFKYTPPKRGVPKARTGGGTRITAPPPPVQALAPNYEGLTSQSQPSLYWYVKRESIKTQSFELIQAEKGSSVLKTDVPIQQDSSIQSIDLTKYNVHLKPDVIYNWQVTLSSKETSRGAIKFIGPSQEFKELNAATPRQLPYLAAKLNLWYDALDWISVLIKTENDKKYWQLQRADLLEQGGFAIIAIHERRTANYE